MSGPSTIDVAESNIEGKLKSLLNEDPLRARRREASALDEFRDEDRPLVIFGAGQLGRRILSALRDSGVEPLAFSDNNHALWNTQLQGVEVLAPRVAADRYGSSSAFLISIWHPSQVSSVSSVFRQLKNLGCRRVAPFPLALWKYADSLLPYYLWDLPSKLLTERTSIACAFSALSDEASKLEFIRQIRLRLFADFDGLSAPAAGCQYFPPDLVPPRPDECFVDCGAYNGDTLSDFLEYCGGSFTRVVAFEPDPANFARLHDKVEHDPPLFGRAMLHNAATGGANGTVTFNANGLASASMCTGSGTQVPCVKLDDVLEGMRPTFIKMDIEGAELDALYGAQSSIQKCRPLLAICVYHAQDHLWRIPLAIRELLPDSQMFIRAHRADGLDLVCYAIPSERSV
jgi:FkbM family methyltransferase